MLWTVYRRLRRFVWAQWYWLGARKFKSLHPVTLRVQSGEATLSELMRLNDDLEDLDIWVPGLHEMEKAGIRESRRRVAADLTKASEVLGGKIDDGK